MNPALTVRNGPVLEVTINRPKANAIDSHTSRFLGDIFNDFDADDNLRVAILTGAGDRFFSAGWDLKAAASHGESEESDHGPNGFGGITEFWSLKKPVIAAVNGYAVGGGAEIMLACDLIIASETSMIFFPETGVGNMADSGGVQRLPRRLPYHVAMDLLYTGRRMSAAEAANWGLVNHVVKPEDVMDKAREIADTIANSAPLSVQAIKQVVNGIDGMSVWQGFEAVWERRFPAYVKMLESEDHEEGPRAFSEKRPPVWKGR